jgi:hypothetical protein
MKLTIKNYNGFKILVGGEILICAKGSPSQVATKAYTTISKSVLNSLKLGLEKYLSVARTKGYQLLQKEEKKEKLNYMINNIKTITY